MRARDELAGVLALVTVPRFTENLTDRQAALTAVRAIGWEYALGRELTDTGFDYTVLARFRVRLVEHGMERLAFDRLLDACCEKGLVSAGGKPGHPAQAHRALRQYLVGVLGRAPDHLEHAPDEGRRHSGVEQVAHRVHEHDPGTLPALWDVERIRVQREAGAGPEVRGPPSVRCLAAPTAFSRFARVRA